MFDQLTQILVDWINTLPVFSVYLAFFGIAYVENIVPPIPGDMLVAFAGYLAAEQILRLFPVLLLTTIASVIGFMSMYALGKHWGMQIKVDQKQSWLLRFVDIKYIEKVQDWMQRWGQGVVLANRFLAGTRSVISLTAGISHTDIKKTIASSFVSSLLWNSILLGFGWFVHDNWRKIGEYLSVYSQIILAAIVLFIAIRIGFYFYRRKYKSNKAPFKKD